MELFIAGSKQSEHQILHSHVICDHVHYDEWFLNILCVVLLGGINFGIC